MATHTGSILSSVAEDCWYWYYNQLFTPAQVDRIHRICTRNEEEEALTGDNHDPELADHTVRKNKVIWSSDDELFGMLFPKLNEANAAAGCCVGRHGFGTHRTGYQEVENGVDDVVRKAHYHTTCFPTRPDQKKNKTKRSLFFDQHYQSGPMHS